MAKRGNAVGRRRETFITTLTGLCVYSTTVAFVYCLPSALRSSATPGRISCTLQQPLPSAKFPSRRATVRLCRFNPCHASHPLRENLSLYMPWTAIWLPSILLILASRVLLNIISQPSTSITLYSCQIRPFPMMYDLFSSLHLL